MIRQLADETRYLPPTRQIFFMAANIYRPTTALFSNSFSVKDLLFYYYSGPIIAAILGNFY